MDAVTLEDDIEELTTETRVIQAHQRIAYMLDGFHDPIILDRLPRDIAEAFCFGRPQ